MRIVIAAGLGLPLIACASPAPDAGPAEPEADASCATFPDALAACQPASCGQPHPIVGDFTIEHTVRGEADGLCLYDQTMPGGMTMSCKFSQDGRGEMARELGDFLKTGNFSFRLSTSDPTPDNAMTRDCVIRGADGQTIPWGVSTVQ